MRTRHALLFLSVAVLAAGAIAACGGGGTGPTTFACTGNTPDLAGTWSLLSIDQGTGAIGPPDATGTFTFTGDSVTVDLTLPVVGNLAGSGKCTLTSSRITITNFLGQADASGTYTFKDESASADTLRASIVATGFTTNVVVTRP